MMKRLPSRNQRSKGIRVKHVLQIFLLLGVCFWLIYQVKRNHDKKKEFAENDAKLSVRTQADQILKLGRKDLHPGKDEANQNEKHEEEEEDENILENEGNKHGHNEEDEGNKHETEESEDDKHEARDQTEEENKLGEEEQEEDDNKNEEMEDENKNEEMEDERRRGGGDDEIDENDQEKTEVDTDRDEELMDEEKEKEEVDEKENENGEDEEKEGGLVENHNTHEAREEQYKGDDASSAVTHDTHTTSTETEAFSLENFDVNLQMNITKRGNETTYSDGSNNNQNDSDLKVTEGELKDKTPSNATSGKEAANNSVSNQEGGSYLNKTATTNSDSNLEESRNMTIVTAESTNNLTGAGADTLRSSERNTTVILSESDHPQSATVNTTLAGDVKDVQTEGLVRSDNRVSEENKHDSDSTAAVKTEIGDAGESSNHGSGELEKTARLVASNETENNSRNWSTDTSGSDKSKGDSESSETEETQNVDATEDEMFKGDTQIDQMSDSSSANGTTDSIEHEAIDSLDTNIHEDVTKVRTDLDTLPDFRNEGENGDEIAAE